MSATSSSAFGVAGASEDTFRFRLAYASGYLGRSLLTNLIIQYLQLR